MQDRDEQEFVNQIDDEDLEKVLNIYDAPDEDELESVEEIPLEDTASYGTGVREIPGYNEGGRTIGGESFGDPELTGGDIDANYEQADAVGDEAVGGTVATPDRDIVDDLGNALGIEIGDRELIHTNEILNTRDDRRWELDPQSSEDYEDR
ncbi:MAG: DUF6335 family protein [Hydrococcus sp. Prado102]|jgi:hypothetical protein|nr:DUF6335 family protein [Hydrococcus sp. Prado102]